MQNVRWNQQFLCLFVWASYPIGPPDALLWFRRFCFFDESDAALFAAERRGDGAPWRSRRGGDRCGPQAAAEDGLWGEGWEHRARCSQGPSSLREQNIQKYKQQIIKINYYKVNYLEIEQNNPH